MGNDINKTKIGLEYSSEIKNELKDNAKQFKDTKVRAKGEKINQHLGDNNFYGQTLEEKYYELYEKYIETMEENFELKKELDKYRNDNEYRTYELLMTSGLHLTPLLSELEKQEINYIKKTKENSERIISVLKIHKDDNKKFLSAFNDVGNECYRLDEYFDLKLA